MCIGRSGAAARWKYWWAWAVMLRSSVLANNSFIAGAGWFTSLLDLSTGFEILSVRASFQTESFTVFEHFRHRGFSNINKPLSFRRINYRSQPLKALFL